MTKCTLTGNSTALNNDQSGLNILTAGLIRCGVRPVFSFFGLIKTLPKRKAALLKAALIKKNNFGEENFPE